MTLFKLLDDSREQLIVLKRNGILTATVLQHMNIYRDFKAMAGTKTQRYEYLGKKYRMNPDYIKKVVNKLSKQAK